MENKAAESTRIIEEPEKELMIGDWVRHVHIGWAIYRTPVRMTAERFFDCGLVRFEPIEVTPEILHKNGFECNMNVTENIECIARKDNLTVMADLLPEFAIDTAFKFMDQFEKKVEDVEDGQKKG